MIKVIHPSLLFIGVLLLSASYSQSPLNEKALGTPFKEKDSLMHLMSSGDSASEGLSPIIVCPLPLSSAIQIGLDNNPEIKSSLGKIKASHGRFWNGISPASPDLSITHDYIPAGANLNKYGEKTVGISQPIDFPTNYFLRGSKYAIEKSIALNEFALAKLVVISNIKKAYFNALALQEQVRIAQENLSIARDFVQKAEVRYSVGEGTNLEKLTAKVNYTEAMNNVEVSKNHLIAAFADLNFAMGYGKGETKTFHLSDTLSFTPSDFMLSQLLNDAETINPQLKVNKLRVESFSREKALAWSSLLPNLNLSYFNKQVRDDAKGYYGASIGIGVPLWFLLDHRGRIKEATANVSIAQYELRTVSNSIYAKTQTAFAEFKHNEKQVQLYIKDVLPQSEEIFRTAVKSYEAGEITYIEFLQAQQTLINSRGNYINALLSYNLSIVAIEEAIGKTLR
jgi:outer membrane protein TolC